MSYQGLSSPPATSAMESLPSLRHSHRHPLHPSLNSRHSTPPFSSFSFFSLPQLPPSSSPFRLSPIRASHSSNSPKPQNTSTHRNLLRTLIPLFPPLLKTACIAAALFLMRLHLQPLTVAVASAPLSPPLTDSTPESLSGEESGSVPAADSMPENLSDKESGSVEALRSLMETKIRERKTDEAIGVIDQLIDLEPEELDWPLLKAHLSARSEDHAAARDLYEEVLKRDPFRVEALHGLLMATSELNEPAVGLLPRIEEAVRFFESEKRDSETRDVKLLVAQVKILEGDLSSALKVYEELVEEEPKDFRPYLCQSVVYTMMEKNEEAERQLEKFRGLVPEDHPYANTVLQKLEIEETAAKR